jgi:hypothetical protein
VVVVVVVVVLLVVVVVVLLLVVKVEIVPVPLRRRLLQTELWRAGRQ